MWEEVAMQDLFYIKKVVDTAGLRVRQNEARRRSRTRGKLRKIDPEETIQDEDIPTGVSVDQFLFSASDVAAPQQDDIVVASADNPVQAAPSEKKVIAR